MNTFDYGGQGTFEYASYAGAQPTQGATPLPSPYWPPPQDEVAQYYDGDEYPDVAEYPMDMVEKDGEEEEEDEGPKRIQHKNNFAGIVILLGYAIGFGNLWRFPYMVAQNGGGAFLIPYFFFLITVASPAFLLEMIIGQKFQKAAYGAFQKMHPAGAGIGLAQACLVFFFMMFYNVLLVWCLKYLFSSFQSPLPWAGNSAAYFGGEVLSAVDSIDAPNSWRIPGYLLGFSVLLWTIIYLALCKGIHATSNAAAVTVVLPVILLLIFFFRVIFLEGASDGLSFYLTPDMAKLGDLDTWSRALNQILFSLSPGMGTALAVASYNPKKTNVFKNNLIISFCNSAFSIFGGFVIFSIVGHMAWAKGVPVVEVASSGGAGLAFIVIAEGVTLMPGAQFWAVLFFLTLTALGLDSSFAAIESLITLVRDLCDKWGWPSPNPVIAYLITTTLFIAGLPFITQGGSYWLDIFDHWTATLFLLFIIAVEVLFVGCVYGFPQVVADLKDMCGVDLKRYNRHYYYYFAWCFTPIASLFLFFSLAFKNWHFKCENPAIGASDKGEGCFPVWSLVVGWSLFVIPFCILVLYMIKYPSIFGVLGRGFLRIPGDIRAAL